MRMMRNKLLSIACSMRVKRTTLLMRRPDKQKSKCLPENDSNDRPHKPSHKETEIGVMDDHDRVEGRAVEARRLRK